LEIPAKLPGLRSDFKGSRFSAYPHTGLHASEVRVQQAGFVCKIKAESEMPVKDVTIKHVRVGVSVPDALSVVGFDGSVLAEIVTPALSTVYRPFGQMAEQATRSLLQELKGHPLTDFAPPKLELIVRESTNTLA